MEFNLEKLEQTVADLEKQMQSSKIVTDAKKMAQLGREYNQARDTLFLAHNLTKNKAELDNLQSSLDKENDPEMISLTKEEIKILEDKIEQDNGKLEELLHPQDPNDQKNIILEIRAGSGGEESALFAADLFRMYSKFAENLGFKLKILSSHRTGIGGFKEIISEIVGDQVYKYFKFESGVHRVQRVPETEKSGRVHTSAASVAVFPEAEETDLEIEPKDLRIDTFCASGHGGQSVNTTYSAVRITHLPTNTVVSCQDEKSQTQNKLKAMQILRSRILAKVEEEQNAKMAADRKNQIGSGDRSEKIRTYNYPQDRLTDHRIKLTLHNLNTIMNGELMPIVENLQKAFKNQPQ
ncbi:MAG: peptide chain release factor 1 [Candidatus Komeilibacteria bacterium CG11_big_fil_rev_8_21_14_0_20_36_20]|uniref:Peptide chain release factor 1 n=1 Tax=Candidatus Komeilibacteria bacterium CG11_big_fil_rev_8_21_14_0_20_36_20 TaxID=1974477 RepID=A0A2H0NDA1_9BACT|nr:MAG: peptide chain release factor 1 [Candidatus Komeilibacteria bacterium CG11_big_fil_rev_8_21_14_0_20_36_20]PIR82057.1 MAG: peptide chain release factor 1 [Candidatus Komeilibacteria bacterium CG10_big_fil_rev_8_21_14_0_10_36_65]PJC55036.1 MAG: peptide chain release factor 1 [Candidatus Komeilibacteria bacterium CG_4_9_14_0_2_um_filter_36_13]